MKKTMAILLSVLLMLFLAVPTFASSAFFSPASVLSRTLRFDLFSFLQWDMRMIRMPSVWDSGLTGQGVQVGIIDSGISAKNRDLDPDRILPGIDFVSGDNALTDTSGHGTFIAGIIGATRHNGFGISGIAPEATLVSMKTSDHKRSEIHHVADAIRACVDDYPCSVINLSSSSKEYSELLEDAGCRVIYGLPGYKVHSKLCLITRQHNGKLQQHCLHRRARRGDFQSWPYKIRYSIPQWDFLRSAICDRSCSAPEGAVSSDDQNGFL